jgi:excisionase family DNA binding protein
MTILAYSHDRGRYRVRNTENLNTAAAAKALRISKATLLRWIKQGKIRDVQKDRNGWRIFTPVDLGRIRETMGLDT